MQLASVRSMLEGEPSNWWREDLAITIPLPASAVPNFRSGLNTRST
jgi:hypothetical protein